ncbi:MAG: DPP IV N-terminal domain-containing protein [Cyclobacteriaceae bacterium]|nr:DPP IV N-terminal domain-containing protein [Cyclobacteriaceae bacterium]
MSRLISILILLTALRVTKAQPGTELSLARIYGSAEFQSQVMGPLRWFDEGEAYTKFSYNEEIGGFDLMKVVSETQLHQVLVSAADLIPSGETQPLFIHDYQWSEDQKKLLIFTNSKKVWRLNTKGDYWVFHMDSKVLKKLGGPEATPATLMFAKFSPQGNRVAYVREHNIYVENLENHEIIQLTQDGTDRIINGTFDWAYEEEFHCRDGFRWSPDGRNIAYWRIDATTIRDFYMINNTDSIYSYLIPVEYPKAGEKPSEAKIGVVGASGGSTVWMQIEGDPTNNYLPRMIWHPNGDKLLMQQLNRAQNHNKILEGTIADGRVKKIYEDKDEAWLEAVDDFNYFDKGKAFSWVSEKNGWKSLYLIREGREKAISPLDSDLLSISLLDEKNDWLYYIASPDNPTQRYLWRAPLNLKKGSPQRVTPEGQSGWHTYQIAPNGKYALHTYSTANIPPVTDLISLPDHRVITSFIDPQSLRKKVAKLEVNPKKFLQITLPSGLSLEVSMIKPPSFDSSKKYPVLFYVYGEPWGQTVVDKWGGSRYLWHQMLAQQGYIVMSIDNRGTPSPKGREWRKCVYGQIGVLSSEDQAAGLTALKERFSFIDGERIGIWGWSGGGSMTLNMMFRYPKLYHTGMSIAPVPDQRLYDNIYQERYSGIPQLMPESYEKGSPITYAQQLEGNLLIVHGTADDNVHYQGTEVLINELVKYNKIFSMLAYPGRSHSINEGDGTTLHLQTTLTHYLNQNLLPGGK